MPSKGDIHQNCKRKVSIMYNIDKKIIISDYDVLVWSEGDFMPKVIIDRRKKYSNQSGKSRTKN